MKNVKRAQRLIEENKSIDYVNKKYKNDPELITIFTALQDESSYNEIYNNPDKNSYTNSDLLELINNYGEYPDFLFLFCKKNNLLAANTLYNKGMKNSANEIIEFTKNNDSEYCGNLVDATVFSEKVKTETVMKIAGKSLEEFIEYLNDHIKNFNGLQDEEIAEKMLFFKLNNFVNNKNLDPIKKSIQDIIKKEKDVIKHLKTSEYVNTDALFFDIFPKVINFGINYKINKKSISFHILNSPFKTKLIDKIRSEREHVERNKKEKAVLSKRISYNVAKFALKLFVPGASIVDDAIEIVDNFKDSMELGSDILSTLKPNQIHLIRKDFIDSGYDSFKQYFFSEIQKGWKSFLKQHNFVLETIDFDIPEKTLYNMYNAFLETQLLKNINQKDATIMEQARSVEDLGAYYLDVIDNQNSGENQNLMM